MAPDADLVDVDHDPTPGLLEAVPLVHDARRLPVRAEPCGRMQADGGATMIAAVVGILTVAVILIVRARRQSAAVDRELMMPGTPPPMVEMSTDPRIPLEYRAHAFKLGKRIVAGDSPPTDTEALWYSGPLMPAVMTSEPLPVAMGHFDAVPNGRGEMVPVPRLGVVPVAHKFAEGGPMNGAVVWFNEYAQMPSPRARETRRDPITGEILNPTPTGCQHPNPEPVVLTTGEVVAAVCPDCLQPLPPSSVGSEWKP